MILFSPPLYQVLEKLSEETNAPAAPVPGSPPTVTFQVVKSDETDRGIKSAVSSALVRGAV